MKLVIEREGGFSVVEDADAITEIDVRSDAVVLTIEVGGDKWTKELPVSSHAEACRVSAAIAVKCGTLVEPLAEAPMTQERVDALYRQSLSNGLEDAEDDDAMGAVMAGRIRKPASEWVEGEPPRDGSIYVAREGGNSLCVRWDGKRWMAGGLPVVFGAGVEHRALGDGVAEGAGVSQWVDGEPPRDGRWYVVHRGEWDEVRLVRWKDGAFRDADDDNRCWTDPGAHLPTPIPER